MRIPYVNNAVMDVLLCGARTVKICKLDGDRYIFSDEGIVAYVLDGKEIYFSMDKCVANSFDFLRDHAPAINTDNFMTKTLDVRVGKRGALLTRLKGNGWDTFVDMDLLEAFDYPNFYQAKPCGIIMVTEGTAFSPREVIRGYVMPVRTGMETDSHYNDRGACDGI